jgi:hypothetical protein
VCPFNCIEKRASGLSGFQTRIVLSVEPDARRVPVTFQATVRTQSLCPDSTIVEFGEGAIGGEILTGANWNIADQSIISPSRAQ